MGNTQPHKHSVHNYEDVVLIDDDYLATIVERVNIAGFPRNHSFFVVEKLLVEPRTKNNVAEQDKSDKNAYELMIISCRLVSRQLCTTTNRHAKPQNLRIARAEEIVWRVRS